MPAASRPGPACQQDLPPPLPVLREQFSQSRERLGGRTASRYPGRIAPVPGNAADCQGIAKGCEVPGKGRDKTGGVPVF